jgi:signal transduction histidine kinase
MEPLLDRLRSRVREAAAIAVLLMTLVASFVVLVDGTVDIGMTVRSATPEQDGFTGIVVSDVTPEGNAARLGVMPGHAVIDLTVRSGARIPRGEPVRDDIGDELPGLPQFDGVTADPAEIESAWIGVVWETVGGEARQVSAWTMVDRSELVWQLKGTAWLLAIGLWVGVAAWLFLAHGRLGGAVGTALAVPLGAALAVPFVAAPIVAVGNAFGIILAYGLAIAASLAVGLAFAERHPDPSVRQVARITAAVGAGLALLLVVRHVTAGELTDARPLLYLLVATVAVAPAIVVSVGSGATEALFRTLTLALLPVAALTVHATDRLGWELPTFLVGSLVVLQVLPLERTRGGIAGWWQRVRPAAQPASIDAAEGIGTPRDIASLVLGAIVLVAALTQAHAEAVIGGVALGTAAALAVRRDLLGPEWRHAAIPLGVAIAVPVMTLAFDGWEFGRAMAWTTLVVALAGLSVAHLLAERHADPWWRSRLFIGSLGVVVLVAFLGGIEFSLAVILSGAVALVPGLPAAFAERPPESPAVASRLETLVVTLTPAAAATVLVGGGGWVLFAAWLVGVVVWRQFTLAPLLGMARRTQLQRDVAVAAAETERARLAADLHDDALQQLTMLVRTLDEGGQTQAADEAREIATKLRSVVGDLRLPILDDLGAGAALEWLVERVEPLAGGPVKLERSDETRPPANVELAVFRVAQEALTNAIKHGRTPIAVRYDVRGDGRVTLAIDDAGDGIGAEAADEAPKAGHFGLVNMQQRAEQIGALLDVRRWPAGGTRVALEWRPQAG